MTTQVVVEIAPDGQIDVRVEGMQGPACVPLARHIAGLLGEAEGEEHTDEFWLHASPEIVALGLQEGWVTPEEARVFLSQEQDEAEDLARTDREMAGV